MRGREFLSDMMVFVIVSTLLILINVFHFMPTMQFWFVYPIFGMLVLLGVHYRHHYRHLWRW